jgi:hypothetical protein
MRCRFRNAQFKQRHIPLHTDITELRLGLYNPFLMEDGDDLHLVDASVNQSPQFVSKMTSYRSYEDVSSFVVALMARAHFEHSFDKYGESRGPRPQAFNSGVAGSSRHRRDLEFRSHH